MYIVYSKPNCPQCTQAKSLLNDAGEAYHEIVLDVGQPKAEHVQYVSRDALIAKIPNAKTMPQIIHNNMVVGGFTELKKYLENQSNKLTQLI